MFFLQFSAVSWVHWCLSTHQLQGNNVDVQVVHELEVVEVKNKVNDVNQHLMTLQSKNVKSVAARSGPSSPSRIDSWLKKRESPFGIVGNRSLLRKGFISYQKHCF